MSRVASRAVSGTVGRKPGNSESARWLIFGLMSASPHARTNATSSRYGDQARTSSPAECGETCSDAGLSPSRRRIDFGFQNFMTRTITTMQVSELMMSVNSGPTKFDT